MKKFFAKILSCTLAAVMALFVLNGCALITTNTERDMAQVIATVAVDEALKEDVYKRELVSAYNSQGYYYVEYQGMTEKEAYETMLEDIVKNRILKQQAKLAFTGATSINTVGYFAQANAVLDADKSSYDHVLSGNNWSGKKFVDVTKTDSLDQFMTEFEYYSIQYDVLSSIRALVDGYKEEEDEHKHDAYETFQGEVRATLTASNEESGNEWEMLYDEEIKVVDKDGDFYKTLAKINKDAKLNLDLSVYTTKYDLALAVYKAYVQNFTLVDDRAELNKIIRDLKKLGFITSDEASRKTPITKEEILDLTYFEDALNIQYENMLIDKYDLALQNEQEKMLASDEALYDAYVNMFNAQQVKFDKDYTAYETALENASNSNLVLYNPIVEGDDSYGYVLNLLIGFNDEQTAAIKSIENNANLTKAQKEKAREDVLMTLTAKDQRSSWVQANYGDYDEETGKFIVSDTYCKTPVLKTFNGDIYGAKSYVYHDSYDDEKTAYSYEAVKATEMPFDPFYANIVSQIMGFTGRNGVLATCGEDEIAKFKDLMFAFSTDPGSLQDNDGYVYSPKTSKTKYVEEFTEAAKNVVSQGVGAYTVVATEFGYHILLCSKVIDPTTTAIAQDKFIADLILKDSNPYLFKEYQKARLVADNASKITSKFFKDNLDSSVEYFEKTYKDLMKEDK